MAVAEPIPKRSDERKLARVAALLRIGHEGLVLDKIQRQAAHVMKLAQWTASGSEDGMQSDAEDDMGCNIGNENHYHIEMKQAASCGMGWLKKLLPIALCAVTGFGGAWAYLKYFAPVAEAIIQQPADPIDIPDWRIGLQVE